MIISTLQLTFVLLFAAFPTLMACNVKHPQAARVAVYNILVGWNPIGWLLLLVWVIATAREPAPARR